MNAVTGLNALAGLLAFGVGVGVLAASWAAIRQNHSRHQLKFVRVRAGRRR